MKTVFSKILSKMLIVVIILFFGGVAWVALDLSQKTFAGLLTSGLLLGVFYFGYVSGKEAKEREIKLRKRYPQDFQSGNNANR